LIENGAGISALYDMRNFAVGVAAALTGFWLAASSAPGQTPEAAAQKAPASKIRVPAKKTVVLHTPWGDPDLQGVWNNATSTPLQRPDTLGAKDVLTDAEAVGFQDQLASDLTRDRRDGPRAADVNRAYNEHWMDSRRLKITADHRTSLIVDPPDGRIPALVPLPPERDRARKERAAALARANAGLPNDYTDLSLPVRCIIRTDSPPYLGIVYNNDLQITQSPGYVAISPEMIHSTRVIPVNGSPHLGACPSIQKSPPSATTSCGRNVLAPLHAASKGISRTGS
jgi:hypothetical protein